MAIEHLDKEHPKVEYWYACPHCPFGCSKHKTNMIKHIRRTHPQKPERKDIGTTENFAKMRLVDRQLEAEVH